METSTRNPTHPVARLVLAGIVGSLLAIAGSVFIGWSDFRIGGTALLGDILALLGAATVTGYWPRRAYRRCHSCLFYSQRKSDSRLGDWHGCHFMRHLFVYALQSFRPNEA
jgi:MFS-type transporter involved in bile tolerance (Atg22 family)